MENKTETGTVRNIMEQSKLLFKGCIIGLIVLILMIPASFIKELVQERAQRQTDAQKEISDKWAGQQNVAGPFLVIPARRHTMDSNGKPVVYLSKIRVLPDQLTIHSSMTPEERYRGIYKVMLYKSNNIITGRFSTESLNLPGLAAPDLLSNEARVEMTVSDVKGLDAQMNWKTGDSTFQFQRDMGSDFEQFQVFSLPLEPTADPHTIDFKISFDLKGSKQLQFVPLGKSNQLEVTSSWESPSFTGSEIPQEWTANEKGFHALWKNMSSGRTYPQSWWNDQPKGFSETTRLESLLEASAFGVAFYQPVDIYQQITRSVKYAALCIALTFAAFFIIELISERPVHLFQYVLVGLALLLFYTLLLSVSEYIGFGYAYLLATAATVGLITWFSAGVLHSTRLSVVLCLVLVLTYTYIFTILQLEDFALLMGSLGLFIALAVIMYFSRKLAQRPLPLQTV